MFQMGLVEALSFIFFARLSHAHSVYRARSEYLVDHIFCIRNYTEIGTATP